MANDLEYNILVLLKQRLSANQILFIDGKDVYCNVVVLIFLIEFLIYGRFCSHYSIYKCTNIMRVMFVNRSVKFTFCIKRNVFVPLVFFIQCLKLNIDHKTLNAPLFLTCQNNSINTLVAH